MLNKNLFVPKVTNLSIFGQQEKKTITPNLTLFRPKKVPKNLGVTVGSTSGSHSGTTSGVVTQGASSKGGDKVSYTEALAEFEKMAKDLSPEELEKASIEILQDMGIEW